MLAILIQKITIGTKLTQHKKLKTKLTQLKYCIKDKNQICNLPYILFFKMWRGRKVVRKKPFFLSYNLDRI